MNRKADREVNLVYFEAVLQSGPHPSSNRRGSMRMDCLGEIG